ncbi:MAG: hypothetical protein DMF61_19840 [Blastocatellia bacterium AA13]|nr:MAG: hypothetical protein DMF61_19840 [Blastocatellia bacterium AA13]
MLDEKGFYKRVCQVMETESANEIACRLSLTKHAIYLWKEGAMPGGRVNRVVAQISELTGTSIHWLLTGEGPRARPHSTQKD